MFLNLFLIFIQKVTHRKNVNKQIKEKRKESDTLNDDSIEGIRIIGEKSFSVQYHPEASPGPHDARYLFDQFVQFMTA